MKMVHEIANWFWRYSNVSDDFILNIDFNKRYAATTWVNYKLHFFNTGKKCKAKNIKVKLWLCKMERFKSGIQMTLFEKGCVAYGKKWSR